MCVHNFKKGNEVFSISAEKYRLFNNEEDGFQIGSRYKIILKDGRIIKGLVHNIDYLLSSDSYDESLQFKIYIKDDENENERILEYDEIEDHELRPLRTGDTL